jgi:hypothetical protein
MNAFDRMEFLSNPANRGKDTILPYINGRNEYSPTGQYLLGEDYYNAMEDGMIRKKDMYSFIESMQKINVNAQWDVVRKKIEEKKKSDLKLAHRNLVAAAKERAGDNPYLLAQYLGDIERLEHGWVDKPVSTVYETAEIEPFPWMLEWAYGAKASNGKSMYKSPTEWNPQAIIRNYYDTLVEVGADDDFYETDPTYLAALKSQGIRVDMRDGHKAPQRPEGASTGGLESMYTNPLVKNWDLQKGVGGLREMSEAMTSMMTPEYRDMFKLNRSMSWVAIKEQQKKNAEYTKYLTLKYAGQEYYRFVSVKQLQSIGVKIPNPRKFNGLLSDLQVWYNKYKYLAENVKFGSDEYKQLYKNKKEEYTKLLSPDWASPLRDGPAARLLGTQLTNPGGNAGLNVRYIGSVRSAMGKKSPDYEGLVNMFSAGTRGEPDRIESANAWGAVLAVAIGYRHKMSETYNEWGDVSGISPTSNDGEVYVNKLIKFVDEWKKRSRRFRTSWDDLGGNNMISGFLNSGY